MSRLPNPPGNRVNEFFEQTDRNRVRIIGEVLRSYDESERNIRCFHTLRDFGAREMPSDLVTLRHDLAGEFGVLSTFANRCDSGVVVSIHAERLAHSVKISIGGWGCDSKAVDETKGFRTLNKTRVHGAVGIQHHRKFNMLATHSALTSKQRCGNCLHGIHRGDLVGSSLAEEHRCAIFGIRLVRSKTGIRLDHGVVRTSLCIRTSLTKSGQRDVHKILATRR